MSNFPSSLRTVAWAYLIDTAPILKIWHDGSPTEAGTAVTAATITVVAGTTNTITLGINGADDDRIGASGIIDCEDALWDTAGEVYDHVNSVQGWNCVLEGALRASVLSEGGREIFLAIGVTTCYRLPVQILRLTDVTSKAAGWEHGGVISQRAAPTFGAAKKGKTRANESEHGFRNQLDSISFTSTFGSGTSAILVYETDGVTETLLHTEVAPTTATLETYTPPKPIIARVGWRLLVILINSADMSAVTCDCKGRSWQKGANVQVQT